MTGRKRKIRWPVDQKFKLRIGMTRPLPGRDQLDPEVSHRHAYQQYRQQQKSHASRAGPGKPNRRNDQPNRTAISQGGQNRHHTVEKPTSDVILNKSQYLIVNCLYPSHTSHSLILSVNSLSHCALPQKLRHGNCTTSQQKRQGAALFSEGKPAEYRLDLLIPVRPAVVAW